MKWPFRRSAKPAPPLFRGTPTVRRVKYYAAETGHTYSYWFRGWLTTSRAFDYLFECRRDRADAFDFRVRLLQSNLDACAIEIGRELTGTERYAVVKLAFFQALDETGNSEALRETVVPTQHQMTGYLEKLGRLEDAAPD